jgi:hypothetical protein
LKKQELVNLIKRKLSKEYGTLTAAAAAFGKERAQFSRAANGVNDVIPDYLLEYVGYKAKTETIYTKVKL